MGGRLQGRTAIITGGAGGIGGAAASIFCEQGAHVVLVDRDAGAMERVAAGVAETCPDASVVPVVADVGEEKVAQNVVDMTVERFGGLDVLVNNVAVRRYESIADSPWENWDEILRVNLLSYVSFIRAALPHLRVSGRGSIVNVSSVYAAHGRKGMGAYDTTKSGLLALTRTLAFEEAEHGVRVNTVCPGYTMTPYHLDRLNMPGRPREQMIEDTAPCVLGRWADPREAAYPILWLASDEGSYITAATLMVDGGICG
ncbi:MAG: SDR family oxidoreductase [Rhodospirillum sp.]|nr:SDR family oxidoreductase [Rhodospirillum sp.]MCF8491780.1 SDR family oxidoreductase [Rhodospirillum sp.]MCF8501419.1 SDR family oxidoreductase [Rhodospirillum sp.]